MRAEVPEPNEFPRLSEAPPHLGRWKEAAPYPPDGRRAMFPFQNGGPRCGHASGRRSQSRWSSRFPSPRSGHHRAPRSPSCCPKIPNFRSGHHRARRNPSSSPKSSRSTIPTTRRSRTPMGPRRPPSGRSGRSRCSRRTLPLAGHTPWYQRRPRSCRSRRSSRHISTDSRPRRKWSRRRLGSPRRRRWVRCRCWSCRCHRTTRRRMPVTHRRPGSHRGASIVTEQEARTAGAPSARANDGRRREHEHARCPGNLGDSHPIPPKALTHEPRLLVPSRNRDQAGRGRFPRRS